jgi:hypothetical protein
MHGIHNEFTATSQPPPQRRAPGSITNKSRVTNGQWVLPGCDMRTPMGRRFRDLCEAFNIEAGGNPSEVEKGLIRAAAAMTIRAEALQAAIVRGESVPADEVIRLTSEARRTLQPIVAKASRRKAAEPSLHDYLDGQAA